MNDREKQIEEMAKIMNYCCNVYDDKGNHIRNKCNTFDCEYYCDTNYVCCSYNIKEATALYEQGYCKIDKGSVVLTKEEFWNLSNKFSKKELDEIVEFHKKKARKQAVKEFAERLKESNLLISLVDDGYIVDYVILCRSIDKTANEFYKNNK